MDFGEFSKYAVLMGLGAAGLYFYQQRQTKTNPDEIHDESQMARLERMLREHEVMKKGQPDV